MGGACNASASNLGTFLGPLLAIRASVCGVGPLGHIGVSAVGLGPLLGHLWVI